MRPVTLTTSNECAHLQLNAKMDDSESKRRNAVSQSGNQPKQDEDNGVDNKETVNGKCFVLCMPKGFCINHDSFLYACNTHRLSCMHARIWHWSNFVRHMHEHLPGKQRQLPQALHDE